LEKPASNPGPNLTKDGALGDQRRRFCINPAPPRPVLIPSLQKSH